MNAYHLLLIAALLTNSVLWTYLHAQRKGSRIYRTYQFYISGIIWWLVTDILLETELATGLRPELIKIGSIGWFSLGFLFLRFIYTILNRAKDWVHHLVFAGMLASITVGLATDLVTAGAERLGRGWHIIAGPLHTPLTSLVIALPALYCITLILLEIRRTSDSVRNSQLRFLTVGTSIVLVFGMATDVVLPNIFGIKDFVLLASSATTIQSLFIYVAVIRHRFMALSIGEVANAVLAELVDGVLIATPEGWITEVNTAAKKTLNISEMSEEGVLVSELFAGKLVFPRAGEQEIELANDARKKDLRISQAEATGAGQTHLGWILIIRDMTEAKTRQQKMEHTQRLESMGVLAGGIAHDFNNILSAIMGNAELMEMDLEKNSPLKAPIGSIIKSSKRAAELAKQMLAYSGRGSFVIKPVNLTELLGEMTNLLEVSIGKQIEVVYHLDESLPTIKADVAQMQQVIMNLVINASEAIGKHPGEIRLASGVMEADEEYIRRSQNLDARPGRFVWFEVSDSGCGMNEEIQKRIFDPFFTTKFTGRGLGMSALLGIVRGHGGTIHYSSVPDQGSTFRILFPLEQDPHTE